MLCALRHARRGLKHTIFWILNLGTHIFPVFEYVNLDASHLGLIRIVCFLQTCSGRRSPLPWWESSSSPPPTVSFTFIRPRFSLLWSEMLEWDRAPHLRGLAPSLLPSSKSWWAASIKTSTLRLFVRKCSLRLGVSTLLDSVLTLESRMQSKYSVSWTHKNTPPFLPTPQYRAKRANEKGGSSGQGVKHWTFWLLDSFDSVDLLTRHSHHDSLDHLIGWTSWPIVNLLKL